MNILVTGGAGFIGSHLCERLLRVPHRLTIIDDLNDAYPPLWKRQNLEEIRRAGDFTFHQADICHERGMAELVRQARPEILVHMAARAGVRNSLLHPLLYERVNVYGTLALLEACRQAGVRRFVFASSSSVYGVTNQVPFREDDQRTRPISPYAATKLAGEQLCYTYAHLYGLAVVCLRLFTVHGPRQRPDLAIHKFTALAERGEPIPVYGDAASARDYTYVADTVEGIVAAMSYECDYEIFNLGNSHPVALSELLRTLEGALGRALNLDRQAAQPGDVPITYADISKARRLLGYAPATPFEEGVRRFVEWYRAARERPGA